MTKVRSKVLMIDCQTAGISGDMFLSALIGLDGDFKLLKRIADVLPLTHPKFKSIKVSLETKNKSGLIANFINTEIKEDPYPLLSNDMENILNKLLDSITLSEEASNFARNVLHTLIKAEARVHGEGKNKHLHELSSADTFLDIVGAAALLDNLNVFTEYDICTTPTALGRGIIDSTHFSLSSPAPATLTILTENQYPIVWRTISGELTTPTGAALLVNLPRLEYLSTPMIPMKTSYGAGKREIKNVPNVVRLIMGKRLSDFSEERVQVVETNVDDVDGETLGYLIDKLLESGAKDVQYIHTVGKKNRPGILISIITDELSLPKVVKTLITETGTLGVRFYSCNRLILDREIKTIKFREKNKVFAVRIKVARDSDGNIISFKPEYEDVVKVAESLNIPFREASKRIKLKFSNILKKLS